MNLIEWLKQPAKEHASPERVRELMEKDIRRLEMERSIADWDQSNAEADARARNDRMKEAEDMIDDLDAQRSEARRLIFSNDYNKRAMGYMWIHLLELRETMYDVE